MIKKILLALTVIILLGGVLFTYRLYSEGLKSQTMERNQDWPFETVEPCPSSPNCVSTNSDPSDSVHHMEALYFEKNPIDEIERIFGIMNIEVTQRNAVSIVGTHQSKLFGFVDDVDFVWDPETGKLMFRSASRVGHSDLEANRKRLEGVIFQLKQSRRD